MRRWTKIISIERALSPGSLKMVDHLNLNNPFTDNRKIPALFAAAILSLILLGIGTSAVYCQESRTLYGVKTPMRDGVELASDIWLPAKEGKYPAIVVRTPYLRTEWEKRLSPEYWTSHGYALVIQDVRGRGDSDGKFHFLFQEAPDGYDTIEWVAKQSWCNGRVGMMCLSYMGSVQWLAAREHPPHLVCIAPTAAAGQFFDEIPYHGGAFTLGWALQWLNTTSGRITQSDSAMRDADRVLEHRPLITSDEALGRRMPLYREFLEHSTVDDLWKSIQFTQEDFKTLDIPALTVTGWFDGDQPGALFYWNGMRANSPAKNDQFLIAGPWIHIQTFMGGGLSLGSMKFSGDSVLDMRPYHLVFFDRYLKQSTDKLDFPRAKLYVTGLNKWINEDQYPPSDSHYKNLYLHSGGKANTLIGDGSLSWDAPHEEPSDKFSYDPKNPCPDGISREDNSGADERAIERRDDVLVYTSEVLNDPLEVIGRIFVDLYAATDGRDTDFTAKLMDVYPDGRSVKLCAYSAGTIRARYRNGFDREELLTPNKPELYKISLFDIAHQFLPGHSIRIEISSSAYPFISPNPNTGNPIATDTESRIANQAIFHNSQMASHVELPVMEAPHKP